MFWICDVLILLEEMDVSIALSGKDAVAAFTTTGVLNVAAVDALLPGVRSS
jgi:hypothetical protein